jgi:hypothetical protein
MIRRYLPRVGDVLLPDVIPCANQPGVSGWRLQTLGVRCRTGGPGRHLVTAAVCPGRMILASQQPFEKSYQAALS